MNIVSGYVPVIHAGYLRFFEAHAKEHCWIFSKDLYSSYGNLSREIRAVDPVVMVRIIRALGIFSSVEVATPDMFVRCGPEVTYTLPDEDVSRHIASRYLPDSNVSFESVFLRYDLPKSLSRVPIKSDREISITAIDRELMERASAVARQSPDWWRQVGVVCVRDGRILYSGFNTHMPSEHSLYALGDPRINFNAGEYPEISCAHHAERTVISIAAGEGVSLAGSSLYVTTFPCQACAYSIIKAKISRIYFREGYSVLDAAEACKSANVELVHVEDRN